MSGSPLLFDLHPLADKVRAPENAEVATFPVQQITERYFILFLEKNHVGQRP